MRMRTFINVKTPNKSVKTANHARYISERERDARREEPESRPVFTHDRDGLKHTAADRYLAGGDTARARTCDLQHVIIAFNSHDARELEKLGGERAASARGRLSKVDTQEAGRKLSKSDIAKQVQVERDRPFAEAVRQMMANLEERTDLTELRYAMAVHRHTDKTHVHLLLRREYASRESGEKQMLHRLPAEFLNGRDEQGKAKAGLLDAALSDALDTMIPRRERPARAAAAGYSALPPASRDETADHQILSDAPHPPDRRPPERTPPRAPSRTDPSRPQPRFAAARRPEHPADPPTPSGPTHDLRRRAGADLHHPPAPALRDPAARPPDHQLLIVDYQLDYQLLIVDSPNSPARGVPGNVPQKNISASKNEAEPAPAGRSDPSSARTLTKPRLTEPPADASRQQGMNKPKSSRGR